MHTYNQDRNTLSQFAVFAILFFVWTAELSCGCLQGFQIHTHLKFIQIVHL